MKNSFFDKFLSKKERNVDKHEWACPIHKGF